MSSLNQCQFIGNLGRDPEVRHTQEGKPVVNMSLAVTDKWTKGGEKHERTTWVPVVIFHEGLAKVAEQYLKKGSKVYISGQFSVRKWQNQAGQDRYATEVVLSGINGKLVMLDSKPQVNDPARQDPPSGGGFDDEIPFSPEWRV